MEIHDCLAKEFNTPFPGYPHFLGTLDSFINTYIFLPFGHLVMKSGRRPELWGAPHNDKEPGFWKTRLCNQNQCKLNDFTYDHNGAIIHVRYSDTRGMNCSEPGKPCISAKKRLAAQGIATQSDASYWASRVLQSYPVVAAALARRFPVLMVDEAQDTSATQMDIIERLVAAGLSEVMLVGDPDQAIYEWREAEPALFATKCADWAARSTTLDENWRSSQHICDLASRVSSLGRRITARNPIVAGYPSTPQLVEYNTGEELRRIIQNFVQSSREQGCDPSTTYVITRGKNTLNEIVPGTVPSAISPWVDNAPDTPAIMQSKYLYDNLDFPQALRLLRRVFGDDKATERGPCFGLLQCLPVTRNATLGGWIATASEVLLSCEEPFRSLRLGLKRRSPKCDYPQLGFADVFGAARPAEPRPDFQLATVHAVKGRSLDAVLLALKTKGGTGPTYQSLLRGNPRVQDQEELRLVYVAMTRAKKLLTIAVPGADQAAWSGYLQLPLQQVQPTHPGRRLTRAPAARS
jgi:hypothetical protein